MDVVAFVLSLVGIATAVGSLVLAMRADRRAARAEHRDERRYDREEAQTKESRSGRPVVTPTGGSGGPSAVRVQHVYVVRNAGAATMTELTLWIEDGEGNTVSTRAGGAVVLAPNADARLAVEVPVPRPARQVLMVGWRDGEGRHVESTGIEPPLSM